MNIKQILKELVASTKRIIANAEQFIQASALLTLTGFSYWAMRKVELNTVAYYTVLAAIIVIGLRGAYEFIRFLDREVK